MTSTNETHETALPIGTLAPDFIAITSEGMLSLDRWQAGSWLVLVSHPGAESRSLGRFAARAEAFEARDAKVLGLSLARTGAPPAAPLARIDSRTARALGLIEEGSEGLRRALIVLDPERAVRVALYYPPGVARSVDGALRLLDALRAGDVWIASKFRTDAMAEPPDLEPEVDGRDAAGEDSPSDDHTDDPPFGLFRTLIA